MSLLYEAYIEVIELMVLFWDLNEYIFGNYHYCLIRSKDIEVKLY